MRRQKGAGISEADVLGLAGVRAYWPAGAKRRSATVQAGRADMSRVSADAGCSHGTCLSEHSICSHPHQSLSPSSRAAQQTRPAPPAERMGGGSKGVVRVGGWRLHRYGEWLGCVHDCSTIGQPVKTPETAMALQASTRPDAQKSTLLAIQHPQNAAAAQLALRRSVEFQWFLIALSVRPLRCCAMRAHCKEKAGVRERRSKGQQHTERPLTCCAMLFAFPACTAAVWRWKQLSL